MWHEQLAHIQSLGSQTPVVGGLAGCAAAREIHVGQFFTPEPTVRLLWHVLGEVMVPDARHHRVNLLDSTCGIGRMFIPADPGRHALHGSDVDGVCTGALSAAVREIFPASILRCSLEEIHADGMDVALINPPFSITFDSPALQNVPGTHRGRYGRHSAAISHWYALGHALEAAPVVGAVLPWSAVSSLLDRSAPAEYCAAVLRVVRLPRSVFRQEGADIEVGLVVFQRDRSSAVEVRVDSANPADPTTWPTPCEWRCGVPRGSGHPSLRPADLSPDKPAITMAVTGDPSVRLVKAGRRIGLRFRCGFTQAMVLNRVLEARIPARPRGAGFSPIPRGVRYTGQGKLDLEVHLAQELPVHSLALLVAEITAVGGVPSVCPSLLGYLRRASRRASVRRVPMRQVAFVPGVEQAHAWLAGRDRVTFTLTCPWVCGSELTQPGTRIEAQRILSDEPSRQELDDPVFKVMRDGRPVGHSVSSWLQIATPEGIPAAGWVEVHAGLNAAVPHLIAQRRAECLAAGIDRILTWGYQWDDALEFLVRGSSICGWKPGLGKSRLAIALCLMGGRQNLIVVEARLIDEMTRELKGLTIPADSWQVISTPEHARGLRRINVISYSRLRQVIGGRGEDTSPEEEGEVKRSRGPRWRGTIARMLRHRIHTLVADEAHCLRNLKSQQTRALWQISPKRVYDLSGTPVASYPRDVLPLLAHAGGDGTAEQPFGVHHPYLESVHRKTMRQAVRGVDQFADMFVTFEWVTNEFLDDLQSGAKREIPRIADVSGFRAAVAPHIKRRVEREPDVAAHITYPVPVTKVTDVAWDQDHLAHYIATVDEFAHWYEKVNAGERRNNLAMILQKVGAVVQAANNPHAQTGPSQYLGGLTSKQTAVLDRVSELADAGHKVLLFAGSPCVLDRFHIALTERQVESVRFHGGVPIAQRVHDMNVRFRDGEVPVLLGSRRCLQQGYNLHQADRVCFYDRSWLATEEEQALARVLRPQQKAQVLAEFFHLEGSIDEYQAQMIAFKSCAMAAGLDYGDPADCEGDFLHLETILARFLDDFGARYGYAGRRRRVA